MRANEFIIETVEEEKELIELSNLIANQVLNIWTPYINSERGKIAVKNMAQYHKSNPHLYISLLPVEDQKLDISSIPSVDKFTSKGLQPVIKFANITIAIFPENNTSAGAVYYPEWNTIYVNYSKNFEKQPIGNLASVISHEMQHAIDDFKTRKNFDTNKNPDDIGTLFKRGQAFTSDKDQKILRKLEKDDSKQTYIDYLKINSEVNARYTQAIKDIVEYISQKNISNIDSNTLMNIIHRYFKKHQMLTAFPAGVKDKNYKRLVSRVYRFLSQYENQRFIKSNNSQKTILDKLKNILKTIF